MTVNDIKKLINPIFRRVMLMVSRARIVKTNDDQTAQLTLLDEEVRDEVEIIQDYGFASRPLDNAEAVTLSVGGNRDHLLIVSTGDKQYLIPLEKGEVALYTDEGDKIHFKRGNCLEVLTAKQLKTTVDGVDFTITKNRLEISDNIEIVGREIKFSVSKFTINNTSLEVT